MLFGKKFSFWILLMEFLGWCYCLLWQMLKPLYLLVELLLVVDGIPLSFDSKADVIAFV